MAYVDLHTRDLGVPVEDAWSVVSAMGGDPRRYPPYPLWRVRGLLDRLLGGPGFRMTGPGRRPVPGDELDFWEVESADFPTLKVRALTKLPGTARLEFHVEPQGAGSRLVVRNTFAPSGLAGHAYWWGQLAAHKAVFALMTNRLVRLIQP
jgi:hypothetical protein